MKHIAVLSFLIFVTSAMVIANAEAQNGSMAPPSSIMADQVKVRPPSQSQTSKALKGTLILRGGRPAPITNPNTASTLVTTDTFTVPSSIRADQAVGVNPRDRITGVVTGKKLPERPVPVVTDPMAPPSSIRADQVVNQPRGADAMSRRFGRAAFSSRSAAQNNPNTASTIVTNQTFTVPSSVTVDGKPPREFSAQNAKNARALFGQPQQPQTKPAPKQMTERERIAQRWTDPKPKSAISASGSRLSAAQQNLKPKR